MTRDYKKQEADDFAFKKHAVQMNPFLKENGIVLNFAGYTSTVRNYFNLDDSNVRGLFKMTKEAILWKDYLSDTYTALKFLLDELIAFGNSLEHETNEYVKNTKTIADLKILSEYIYSRIALFDNIYWHCKKLYVTGVIKA